MRIRKNLKLSSTSSSSSSEDGTFHAHVCQLNQSPWDLIPFDSHSIYQFEYDDNSFTAATAAANGDSIGAVESVASMMDIDEQAKLEDVAAIAMMELVDDNAKGSPKVVTANNGIGGSGGGGYNKKPAAAAAPARGGGSRASANKSRAAGFKKPAAATTSSTNPYEFYYYSGFGPTWSTKRRGDRSGKEVSKNNGVENLPALQRSDDDDDDVVGITTTAVAAAGTTTIMAPTTTTTTDVVVASDNNSTMEENVEELDYDLDLIDDEEEDDDDDGNYYYDDGDNYGKNKRMRKPVKARSLKSLM